MELTHASFFSGVGGMDVGLERAGWRTVSFSEIDPYACAVLAERWPDVPNLGDIVQLDSRDQVAGHQPSRLTDLADRVGTGHPLDAGGVDQLSLGGDDAGTSAGHGHERSEDVRRDGVSAGVGLDAGDRDDLDLRAADDLWRDATLWTAGFPCQDLSVAGKRSGFGGERSVLAFTFLDLVERHRPHAFLLENVPGLLTSNAGRDLGRLLREVGELGYWWAYRVLDAQWFGVPQRRKRVFILAIDASRHPDPHGPSSVLSIGTRCDRDHQAEREAWAKAPERVARSPAEVGWNASAQFGKWEPSGGVTQTLATRDYKSSNTVVSQTGFGRWTAGAAIGSLRAQRGRTPANVVINHQEAYAAGMREADGLAGWVDDQRLVAPSPEGQAIVYPTLRSGGHGDPGIGRDNDHDRLIVSAYVKAKRAQTDSDDETSKSGHVSPTINGFDVGDTRATVAVFQDADSATELDELLPAGIDSNRFKVIGNGVASPVAEWIGRRLAQWLE